MSRALPTRDQIDPATPLRLDVAAALADKDEEIERLANERDAARAAADRLRAELRMQWCLACGTVSADGGCDCTKFPETAELRRAVDYAKEFGEMVREQARELAEAKAEVERLVRALLIAAPHHQGRHSQSGNAIAYALGISFPITMDDLEERACEAGLKPSELWPWWRAALAHGGE